MTFERCWCTGVDRARVEEVIRTRGCATVDEIRSVTGACGGCGTCRPDLVRLLRSLREGGGGTVLPTASPG